MKLVNLIILGKAIFLFLFISVMSSCNDDDKFGNIHGYWQQNNGEYPTMAENPNLGDIIYFTEMGEYYIYKKVNPPFKTSYTFFWNRFYILKQGRYVISNSHIKLDDISLEYFLNKDESLLSILSEEYNSVFSYPFIRYNQRPSICEEVLKDLNRIFYYTLADNCWGIFYEDYAEISIGCQIIQDGDENMLPANKNSTVTFRITDFTYAYTTLEGTEIKVESQDIIIKDIKVDDERITNGLRAALLNVKPNGIYKIWIPWQLHNGKEGFIEKDDYQEFSTIAYTIELISVQN